MNSRIAIPLCTFYRHSIGVFSNIGELLSYQGYHNKHEKGWKKRKTKKREILNFPADYWAY